MKSSHKVLLTSLSIALTLSITACTTVDTEKPHTETYKGEYYDREQDDTPPTRRVSFSNTDFEYNYPGEQVQSASSEITNATAEETYRYAMTLKEDNPLGMIEALYAASAQGSGNAHYELARELTSGINIEKNAIAAHSHLQDAVDLNHAEALRVLGLMNIRGDSMAVNIPAGMAMLERAAQSSTRATRELGYLYQGKAYPQIKDTEQAIRYLKAGYAKGDNECAYLLGEIYYDAGKYIEALEPLSFASGNGHAKATQLIARLR